MNTAGLAETFEAKGNPIITDRFTADPAALVVGDTVYLYVGHDEAKDSEMFNIKEWLCYSTKDMKNWTYHGPILKPTDFTWAVRDAWASQVVQGKDGKFYFYVTVQSDHPHYGKAVGVAVSDSPAGPFRDARGSALITDNMTQGPRPWDDIDPHTFVDDDDGSIWMAWGNGVCYMVRLSPNMIELDSPIYKIRLPHFEEGPWIHKRNEIYYMTYASHVASVGSEMFAYATAEKMEGPWTYRGVLTGRAERSFTIHPAIIDFKGQGYLFYHNAALTIDGVRGALGRRAVCAEYLYYLPDGTMAYVPQTKEGVTVPPKTPEEVAQIRNPFPMDAPDEKIWLFDAAISSRKSLADNDFTVPEGFDRRKPDVKYGEVKTITYHSTTTEGNRNATIILPPNFDENKKYPVLYLLHGIGGDEREWLGGNPNEIINNLVAEEKTKEMIVVIPNIRARHSGVAEQATGARSPERFREFDNFLHDLRDDLMPHIEKHYPILTNRDSRAVAGLSMGGRSALHVGFRLADAFGYIGAFTPAPGILPSPGRGEGLFTQETFTLPREYRTRRERNTSVNNTLIMITKGSTDGVVGSNPENYSVALNANEIEHIYYVTEGGHDFGVWKHNLYNFVRRIFR